MSSGNSEARRWSGRRWFLVIGLVFAGQVGLIFLLGEHSPVPARTRGPMPGFRLASPAAAELLALGDPTLFALPHPQGFSGKAWLHGFSQKLPSFDWSEEPRWLPLPASRLGQTFKQFMETNEAGSDRALSVAESELMVPDISSESVLREESTLRLGGALAQRQPISPPQLKAWRHEDVLTNTVVHVVVDGRGQTISSVLLPPGSGSREADQYALEQARAARFESIEPSGPRSPPNPTPQLTSGEMIFQWHTLPMPATNAPPPLLSP
jgi:hypothetical protein